MKTLNVALIGPGLVGSEFIKQITSSTLPNIKFKLISIANSKQMLLSTSETIVTDWQNKSNIVSIDYDKFQAHCKSNAPCVIVDCTSSDAIANQYPKWLQQGIHVITPNKKAFSGGVELWNDIQKTSNSGPFVYHEATVGAGLPILSTLNDIVNTGDKVLKIEGIFSGTLSYIFNTFSAPDCNLSFSEIVKVAKEKGFTEPDPRDDLNGVDVARKVCILGRLSKMSTLPTLSTISTENIVPPALRPLDTTEFMNKLSEFDSHFNDLKLKAAKENSVLRYVGVVDVEHGKCTVELKSYPLSHPFASLKGSDNIIAFHTARFSPNPLIVQGAGAGAAVTAFGIFSDLLKLANRI